MKHLQNRTTLSFGIPLAITAILLLILNVFLVKKNADGDYIDNGLKYVTSSGSDNMSWNEQFEQYQDQGYIDSETITYEGEEVINYRNDIEAALKKWMDEYYVPKTNIDTSDTTKSKLVTDPDIIAEFNTRENEKKTLEKEISNIKNKIKSHNNTRNSGRLIGTIILILFPIYVLPISICFFRLHSYRWPISIMTVFTGWTGIGFIIMLTWSVWPRGKFT